MKQYKWSTIYVSFWDLCHPLFLSIDSQRHLELSETVAEPQPGEQPEIVFVPGSAVSAHESGYRA